MSGAASHDLSGDWFGMYNYPHGGPPTRFEATVRDHGGAITGETAEPDLQREPSPTLHPDNEGTHDGERLRFTKFYDDLEFSPEPILYDGRIDRSGDEIEGGWTIPGVWSGTFLMVRGARREEAVAQEVAAEA